MQYIYICQNFLCKHELIAEKNYIYKNIVYNYKKYMIILIFFSKIVQKNFLLKSKCQLNIKCIQLIYSFFHTKIKCLNTWNALI